MRIQYNKLRLVSVHLAAALMAMLMILECEATIIVTRDTDATSLANALISLGGSGINVSMSPAPTLQFQMSTNATFFPRNPPAVSSGTFTVTGVPEYGLFPNGIVLSTGDVSDYGSGPNTLSFFSFDYGSLGSGIPSGVPATASQELLLDPIPGGFNHPWFDVTQLNLTLDVPLSTTNASVLFHVVFGSEEFPEFTGYNDAFGIYLNNINIAVHNGNGLISQDPLTAFLPGTELDGVILPNAGSNTAVLTFTGALTPGANTLTLILGDQRDGGLDSTVYIRAEVVPEPSTLILMGVGLMSLLSGAAWNKRRVRGRMPQ